MRVHKEKKRKGMTLYTNDRLCVKLTAKGHRHLTQAHRKMTRGGRLLLNKKEGHYAYTCSFNTFLIYFGGANQAFRDRGEGLFVANQMEVL
jgi:hypothetical protein